MSRLPKLLDHGFSPNIFYLLFQNRAFDQIMVNAFKFESPKLFGLYLGHDYLRTNLTSVAITDSAA
jgi:hypothetical protein